MDGLFGIGMSKAFNQFVDLNQNPKLFLQFAGQTFFIAFAVLNFSAGKFPEAAEMSVRITLGDQEFAIAKY